MEKTVFAADAFAGKTVLISGGTSGIGLAAAETCSSVGPSFGVSILFALSPPPTQPAVKSAMAVRPAVSKFLSFMIVFSFTK